MKAWKLERYPSLLAGGEKLTCAAANSLFLWIAHHLHVSRNGGECRSSVIVYVRDEKLSPSCSFHCCWLPLSLLLCSRTFRKTSRGADCLWQWLQITQWFKPLSESLRTKIIAYLRPFLSWTWSRGGEQTHRSSDEDRLCNYLHVFGWQNIQRPASFFFPDAQHLKACCKLQGGENVRVFLSTCARLSYTVHLRGEDLCYQSFRFQVDMYLCTCLCPRPNMFLFAQVSASLSAAAHLHDGPLSFVPLLQLFSIYCFSELQTPRLLSVITKNTGPHVAEEVALSCPSLGLCPRKWASSEWIWLFLDFSCASVFRAKWHCSLCFGFPWHGVRGPWEPGNEDKSVEYSQCFAKSLVRRQVYFTFQSLLLLPTYFSFSCAKLRGAGLTCNQELADLWLLPQVGLSSETKLGMVPVLTPSQTQELMCEAGSCTFSFSILVRKWLSNESLFHLI